jgi:peptide/nickel transport system substrate-binding protein
MLKGSWVLLVMVTAALLTLYCANSERSPTETWSRNEKNILRIDVLAPFGSLDPFKGAESGCSAVFPLLYSYLFVPNEQGQLEPDLAIRWYYDTANFTWTILLRDDAMFHDGRRVTARDAQYSLGYWLRSPCPSLPDLIDRMTILTDTALLIRLKRNDPDFPMKIWHTEIVPHPAGTIPDPLDHPIGSGPFRFTSREGDKEIGLTADKSFYGGRPSLDGVVFTYEPDSEKSWANLLMGKIDIGVWLSPKDYRMMKQYDDRFYFVETVFEYYTILLFNTVDPLFSDPNVRLALAYAVDKQAVVDKLFHGAAVAAIGPAGVDSPYHNPNLQPVPYNPTKALDLLREAGWDSADDHFLHREGKVFELTVLIFERHKMHRLVAEYIQLFLNDVGIKTHLQSLPQDEIVRRYAYNNEFQAVLTQMLSCPQEVDMPEIMEMEWAGMNGQKAAAGSFEHSQVAAILHEAALTAEQDRRKELYQEADALIASLQPGVFLFHEIRFDAMSKRFHLPHHFSSGYSGIYRLRNARLAPH